MVLYGCEYAEDLRKSSSCYHLREGARDMAVEPIPTQAFAPVLDKRGDTGK